MLLNVPLYCVKIPPVVYRSVGRFDEQYGLAGWEDTDYIVRAYLKGFPLFFAMESFVLHFYGLSTWRPEEPVSFPDAAESETPIGPVLFEKKWGPVIKEIFGYQGQEGMARLKMLEDKALIDCYTSLILANAPFPAHRS